MLVHARGHLHLETPPIEPYMVTTLPFKNHVIQTLTPTQKLLCALAKQISTISENKLPVQGSRLTFFTGCTGAPNFFS